MIWLEYNIEQAGSAFIVKGDWHGEVMGVGKDGKFGGDGAKTHTLYKPGDIYEVQDSGWLKKIDMPRFDTWNN
jgi:hypothetical protein|tara:strand:- start:417 stop:635 length:219 start_codon:yes stop_codon:yes gene_type:complete